MRPAAQVYERGRQLANKCIVCGNTGAHFERFAACDEGCRQFTFRSSRAGSKTGSSARGAKACFVHQPRTKERFHVRYCSLRCFNSWEWGHRARSLQGEAIRRRRQRGWRESKRLFKQDMAQKTYR